MASQAILSGGMAGGLHAVTGPDHMAALLPMCMGKHFFISCQVGALWGLGHGLGASLMGAVAFTVKDSFDVMMLSDYLEAAVGVTLICIGAYGLKESRDWYRYRNKKLDDIEKVTTIEEAHRHDHDHVHTWDLGPYAMVTTGIFHGFSGTGHLLGVIPALLLPSWNSAALYLVSFCLGTTIAMSLFTGIVGQVSMIMRSKMNVPDLPVRLSMTTSVFAIAVGCLWILKTFFFEAEQHTTPSELNNLHAAAAAAASAADAPHAGTT
eukprot:CAMPEP_0167786954 /NCGR_PEP_ID=MMETSP0111_2-20121227/9119_1 /TAXON_ID=91324 /ORGANISM="Lotharella globosa, Strain CCCM811" /LENGTH=264 /DNA_ID=CAMNT_0007678473 /DNA_START=30 /DNA_END=824 /DNA_ORIENTATION=-